MTFSIPDNTYFQKYTHPTEYISMLVAAIKDIEGDPNLALDTTSEGEIRGSTMCSGIAVLSTRYLSGCESFSDLIESVESRASLTGANLLDQIEHECVCEGILSGSLNALKLLYLAFGLAIPTCLDKELALRFRLDYQPGRDCTENLNIQLERILSAWDILILDALGLWP